MPTNILATGGAGYAVHVLDNFRFDQTSLTDCCLDANFRRSEDTAWRPGS